MNKNAKCVPGMLRVTGVLSSHFANDKVPKLHWALAVTFASSLSSLDPESLYGASVTFQGFSGLRNTIWGFG